MLGPYTCLARYRALCSGMKKAMSPIDGFTFVGDGVDLLPPLTELSGGKTFSNSFLNRTALPYDKPSLPKIGASASLAIQSFIVSSVIISSPTDRHSNIYICSIDIFVVLQYGE